MVTITRRMEFDAGHRVLGHEGKCKYLHGHRYAAEVTVQAPELDGLGRVVDFSVIKTSIGAWIDASWDHNLILHPDDPLWQFARASGRFHDLEIAERFLGRLPFGMPDGFENPTAENIAAVLSGVASTLLNRTSLEVVSVRIYETPNCWADWRKSDRKQPAS